MATCYDITHQCESVTATSCTGNYYSNKNTCNQALFKKADADSMEGVSISGLRGTISKEWNTGADPVFATPGGFISATYPYLFGFAGIILFVMLIWGAMEIFFGGMKPDAAKSGQKRITTAIIGFFLLFATFWFGQILAGLFGLDLGLGQ